MSHIPNLVIDLPFFIHPLSNEKILTNPIRISLSMVMKICLFKKLTILVIQRSNFASYLIQQTYIMYIKYLI